MKKILIILSLLFLTINSSYACKIKMLWKEIPKEFDISCYEKSWVLNPNITWFDIWNWEKCIWWNTFKVNSSEKINTFISENYIIPHKLYKSAWVNASNFEINLDWNKDYLGDNNYKTSLIYDTRTNKEIIIKLNQLIKSSTYYVAFSYETKDFIPRFKISEDWIKYFSVNLENISNYDIKFLKIKFDSTVMHDINEKIQISELSFKTKNYEYLIKTRWTVEAYSKNMCSNYYPFFSNNTWDFNIDTNTETLTLKLEHNKNYDVLKEKDSDYDLVSDKKDNCPSIYNPLQKDKNWDWRWDLCSDDDTDLIIWDKDNCIYVYNPKQTDINRNWIWDRCEFDKDEDGIYDGIDNCINTYNPNQEDLDNDDIWDNCDNCIYYNPRQLDINNNWNWDVCEEKNQLLEENDEDSDWIINSSDNCINIANPEQEDSDKDYIWDVCDNCINIQNRDQLDFNENWIWDICEDSDWDWIDWIIDNCINISNSDQKDTDNDWIWDMCEDDDRDDIKSQNDNCPYIYNPEQNDIDKDGVWDKCDDNDNRYIESNSTFFIWLLIFITLIFGTWIYIMIKKLK